MRSMINECFIVFRIFFKFWLNVHLKEIIGVKAIGESGTNWRPFGQIVEDTRQYLELSEAGGYVM